MTRAVGLAVRALFLALALCLPFVAAPALGASPVEVTARASSTRIEVGEPFTITIQAIGKDAENASSPTLRVPSGLVAGSAAMQSLYFMKRRMVQSGTTASWQVKATREGSFVIDGPSIVVGGERFKTKAIKIEVVASTGRPKGQLPFSFPPGFNLPFPNAQPEYEPDDDAVPDPELRLSRAPDSLAFVRAIVDKTTAVVGEQINVSFYAYCRFGCEWTPQQRVWNPDFFSVDVLANPDKAPTLAAMVAGERFAVSLVDRVALFAVHAGDLRTPTMKGQFKGRRLGRATQRESEAIVVRVTEPPLANRPPGYVLGNVGKYSIAASVQPRRLDQSGSTTVAITVAGTGNIPDSLTVPDRVGVEWSDPEKIPVVKKHSVQAGVVGGTRTFTYVVRIKESGSVDLGKVELPFWDPAAKKYDVVSASLGSLEVKPTLPDGPPKVDDSKGSEGFTSLPAPRLALSNHAGPTPIRAFGGPRLWMFVLAPPLFFGSFVALSRATRRFRARRARYAGSPRARAEAALADAQTALSERDDARAASAIERALHAAVEAKTGLKSRGVLLDALPAELTQRGIDAERAGALAEMLSACDKVRFDPDASRSLAELLPRARAVAAELYEAT